MGLESKFIWMDGSFVDFEKATVHFLSPTLHYGVGVFEGIRCYNTDKGPAVFRLKEHMKRLLDSALILGFRDLSYTVEGLSSATRELIVKNGLTEAYIRPLIFMNCQQSLGLNMDSHKPAIGIAAWYWANYLGEEALEKGIRGNVSSFTRHHPNISMTKAKIVGSYANSMLAKTESVRLGFEEAIMLDPQGYVAECTGENLFIVRNGKLYTSPTATILEGITRDSIITLAQDLGIEVLEQPISRDQLYISDEIFVCGTAAECIPLCEIDYRKIGQGKRGAVTLAIQEAYHAAIHGKHKRSAEWLDYIK